MGHKNVTGQLIGVKNVTDPMIGSNMVRNGIPMLGQPCIKLN